MKSSNIYQAVWLDKDFRRYDYDTKMLFLYFLTNANSCGILELDDDIYNYITKVEHERIHECVETLKSKGKIMMDDQPGEVFLKNHFKYNNPANSTKRHLIKFRSDYETIKSEVIKKEVKNKASAAVRAAEKPEPKKKTRTVSKPHVDS